MYFSSYFHSQLCFKFFLMSIKAPSVIEMTCNFENLCIFVWGIRICKKSINSYLKFQSYHFSTFRGVWVEGRDWYHWIEFEKIFHTSIFIFLIRCVFLEIFHRFHTFWTPCILFLKCEINNNIKIDFKLFYFAYWNTVLSKYRRKLKNN